MASRLAFRIAAWWLAGLLAPPLAAETIIGTADVVDGDSLVLAGRQIRLVGIDAPEYEQTCTRAGQGWPCGAEAKAQLTALAQNQRLECTGTERDAHLRLLAVCSAGYLELNKALVAGGWAVAYRAYSDAYVGEEAQAKAARVGIWDSTFVTPADFRLSKLPPAATREGPTRYRTPAPRSVGSFAGGCVIKGNHSRRGEWIYHLPGMPYYNQTRAEEMFCTEEQAQRAGYRRAIVRP